MLLLILPTRERLIDLAIALTLLAWGIYKKEAQDGIRKFFGVVFGFCTRLFYSLVKRFILQDVAVKLTDKELEKMQKARLGKLRTWLLHLCLEYRAQRATVVRYTKTDTGYMVTCLAESVDFEMVSITDDLQFVPVEDSIWSEVERINNLEGRYHYVKDARLLDIAALRDVLLRTDVRTAFYQSLPNEKGKPWAMLSLSWKTDHPLTEEELRVLHLSGMACSFVLQSMMELEELGKASVKPSTGG